jgi:hypothetical protein
MKQHLVASAPRLALALVLAAAGGIFGAAQDTGRAVFETVLDAYGPRPAVQSLNSYRLVGTATDFADDVLTDGAVEILYKKPDRYKETVTRAGETVTLGRDGAEWWDAERVDQLTIHRRHLEPREVARHRRRLELDLCHLLAFPPGQLEVQLLDDPEVWDGRDHWVLKIWQKNAESRWLKLLVDPATRLIRRADSYVADPAADAYEEFGVEYLDYAVRDQVQFPGRIRRYAGGRLVSEIRVESVSFNVQLPASEFKPE